MRMSSRPRFGALLLLFAALLAALLVALLVGCSQESPERPPPTGAAEAPAPDAAEIERLRSLPYAGGTPAAREEPTGVVQGDPARLLAGYRLYEVPELARADLIDAQGELVHAWRGEPGEKWQRAELLASGDLLVVGQTELRRGGAVFGPVPAFVRRYDWSGRRLWERSLPAHHDIEETPQGKLLVLTMHARQEPSAGAKLDIRDDHLTLLEPDGSPIASHSFYDAVRSHPDLFPLKPVQPARVDGPLWVDLFHSNSAEWMHQPALFGRHPLYGPDNVLVSFRHQDRIAIFHWPTNEVLWSWGIAELVGPHDARMLESGRILVFDNGLGRGWSRVLEVDPRDGRIAWEYRGTPPESFYTASKGSSQRLPNGHTLIAESDKGRAFEIDSTGTVVWEFICPHWLPAKEQRAAIGRIIWHPAEAIEPLLAAPRAPAAAR